MAGVLVSADTINVDQSVVSSVEERDHGWQIESQRETPYGLTKTAKCAYKGEIFRFNYFVRNAVYSTGESPHPILVRGLRMNDDGHNVIGILYPSDQDTEAPLKVAWSNKTPRHLVLAQLEEPKYVARFQTNTDFSNAFPKIQVHSRDLDSAIEMVNFLRGSGFTGNNLDVSVTNAMSAEETGQDNFHHLVFTGLAEAWDEEKIRKTFNQNGEREPELST